MRTCLSRLLIPIIVACVSSVAPQQADAQSTFTLGAQTFIGSLPAGFQQIEETMPDPASKRWGFVGEPGPDGIRPVITVGLFGAPPPGVTFTIRQFADFSASGFSTTYGNWTGQFTAAAGDRLRLEWSGLLRRPNDIVPVRGVMVVGASGGGFFRLDAYDSMGRANQTLPIIERAFATFSTNAALASAPAPTREQRWNVCAESNDLDAVIAACTFLAQSPEETPLTRPFAYYNRGNAYHDKRDTPRAIADFDEAIRLNPAY